MGGRGGRGRASPGSGSGGGGGISLKRTVNADGSGSIDATGPGGSPAGRMSWTASGKIHDISVPHWLHGQGIGTRMWNAGQKATGGRLSHSPDRTDAGDRFARKVGGTTPPRSDWRP